MLEAAESLSIERFIGLHRVRLQLGIKKLLQPHDCFGKARHLLAIRRARRHQRLAQGVNLLPAGAQPRRQFPLPRGLGQRHISIDLQRHFGHVFDRSLARPIDAAQISPYTQRITDDIDF